MNLLVVVPSLSPTVSPSPDVIPPPDNPWAAGFWAATGIFVALIVVFVVAYRLGAMGWPLRHVTSAYDVIGKRPLPDEPTPRRVPR